MIWKVTITTRCGAKCKTCPCHALAQHRTMSFPTFHRVLNWIEYLAQPADTIFLNGVGDVMCLLDAPKYLARIAACPLNTSLTTNGLFLNMLPKVRSLVISFNGGTLEAHHAVTGLDSARVLANIQRLYPDMLGKHVEIHCLICKLNEGTEGNLLKLFEGFPGRIRVSYKCENQGGDDLTVESKRKPNRIPCDYLENVTIDANGFMLQCPHDFEARSNLGFAQGTLDEVMHNPERVRLRKEHCAGVYTGLCERCNYNIPNVDQTVYLK